MQHTISVYHHPLEHSSETLGQRDVDIHALLPQSTDNGDLGDLKIGLESKVTLGGQNAQGILELDVRDALLLQADTVIKVKLTLGNEILADRDDELKVLLAKLGGGHGRLGPERNNDATTKVERDISQALVLDGGGLALAVNDVKSVPVIEDIVGKVDINTGRVLLSDGSDEETGTVEVLVLEAKGVGVLGIKVEHGVDHGGTIQGLLVLGSVDVIEQAVADIDGLAGGLSHTLPAVELLADDGKVLVVVAVKGSKGTEHGPASAERLGRVSTEATNISAHHRDLVDRSKGHHCVDALAIVLPVGNVVTEPFANRVAGASKGGASDDEGAEARTAGKHGSAGLNRHHGAVKVVNIIFSQAILVDGIGIHGLVRETALVGVPRVQVSSLVVNRILGEEKVTARKTKLLAGSNVSLDSLLTLSNKNITLGRGLNGQGLLLLAFGSLGLEDARPARELPGRSPHSRRLRRVADSGFLGVVAGEEAREVGGFVHVNPETVNVNARARREELSKLIVPVLGDVGGEPVGEDRDTRPYDTLVEGTVIALEEDVLFDTAGQSGVLRSLCRRHGRIDHDNVLLVVLMEVADQLSHGRERETLRIQGKDPSAVHVVNIGPHRLKGNAGLAVVVDNLGNLEGILIAVAALVEAKTPVGHHGRDLGDLGVLLGNLDRAGAGHEIEVKDASKGVILEVLTGAAVLVNDDVDAVGVEEQDTVTATLAVLVVDRVVAIKVRSVRSGVGILRPESPDVVGGVEAERVRVLTETVQVRVLGELGTEAKVLGLEDQGSGRSIEEDLTGLGAGDGEGERVGLVVELQGRLFGVRTLGCLRARKDRLGDLIHIVGGILDLDVEAVV